MRVASKLLLGLVLLQGSAYADEPKIEVIDGKISITAQAVPLGRFLAMFDKAMGLKSEVKPGLENRNVSVQFTGLNFNEAIRKIFQGQPYNYVVTQGKGIKVIDLVTSGASSGVPETQSFSNPSQPFNAPPPPQINNVNNPNFNNPNQAQPAASSIFGGPAQPAANANAPNPNAPLSGPGVIPPPLGANNPLNNPINNNPVNSPIGGSNNGGNILPNPAVSVPSQPPPPGVIPGAAPGAAPGTIK
jgi:hypothetical protein